MKIDNDTKLDFEDVLLKPKRSTLSSRSEVILDKTYTFKFSKERWTGVPIIAANMDSTGTMEIASVFNNYNMMTALHKHYSMEQLFQFYSTLSEQRRSNVWYSMGMLQHDYEKHKEFKKYFINQKICIDVANGYTETFVDFIKKMRDENQQTTIMAGNVVTAEMTEALIFAGADVVKVGIGPGCFIPGSLVLTKSGLVPIEKIKIGDRVLTHKGNWQMVTNVFIYQEDEKLVNINGIKSTAHHEYYVLHKSKNDVTDAEWIKAKDITADYYLLKHLDDKIVPIQLIEKSVEPYSGPVHDLEVGGERGDHSYNIDGIIVHNSVCTTRKMASVGMPQLSAIIECSDAAHGLGGLMCSDGGCTTPGDVAKSFAANSDFTMIGGMFAGHDDSGGEIITKRYLTNLLDENDKQIIEEKKFKIFYGMSSSTAMNKYSGGVAEYRASEGKTVELPYKGPIENTVKDILGGVRSTCTYTGSKTLKELPKRATFIKVSGKQQINNVFGKS